MGNLENMGLMDFSILFGDNVCDDKVYYDKDFDVLYIEPPFPEVAQYDMISDDVYLRKSIVGERIIGALIFDYSTKELKMLEELLPTELSERLPKI